jgi:hypothetical protein
MKRSKNGYQTVSGKTPKAQYDVDNSAKQLNKTNSLSMQREQHKNAHNIYDSQPEGSTMKPRFQRTE